MTTKTLAAALALLVLAWSPAAAKNAENRRECQQGCQETLRSCKADCRPERDSGTQEASQLYVDCDAQCHDNYSACADDCRSE
jgi:hypothetical protein